MVWARPDVLIAGFGTLTAQAAKVATTTIPTVFTLVGDPVGAGLVASLGRPGGNATGLSGLTEIGGKQVQLLQELTPGHMIAVLMNPDTPYTWLALKEIGKPPARSATSPTSAIRGYDLSCSWRRTRQLSPTPRWQKSPSPCLSMLRRTMT
jgi:hypothetical protein